MPNLKETSAKVDSVSPVYRASSVGIEYLSHSGKEEGENHNLRTVRGSWCFDRYNQLELITWEQHTWDRWVRESRPVGGLKPKYPAIRKSLPVAGDKIKFSNFAHLCGEDRSHRTAVYSRIAKRHGCGTPSNPPPPPPDLESRSSNFLSTRDFFPSQIHFSRRDLACPWYASE